MAVQKCKVTRSRRGQRRSHDALKSRTLSVDPVSGEKHLRHQMTKDGKVTGKKEQEAGLQNKFLGSYYFVDAFPTSVGEIALSRESGGEIEYFEVTFEYQYWVKKPSVEATNDNPFKEGPGVAAAKNWVENPSSE